MGGYLSFLLLLIIQQCGSQVTRQISLSGSGTSLMYSLFFNVYQGQTVTMTYSTRCPNLYFTFVNQAGSTVCNYATKPYNNGATYSMSCSLGVGTGQKLQLSDWNGTNYCNYQFSYQLSFNCANVTNGCYDCTSYTTCTSCVSGYYFYLNRCYQYPSYCLAVTATYCTVCQSAYFTLFGVCRRCSSFISNCFYCSNNSTCTTCYTGYALTSTFQCDTCSYFMSNCVYCSSNSTCTTCMSGYVLKTSSICQACTVTLPNCITCSSLTQCTKCVVGYGIISNGSCATCSSQISNCALCNSALTCTKCASGYSTVSPGCVLCPAVIASCLICAANGSCQRCDNGYGLDLPSVTNCKLCSLLIAGCEECIDNSTCTKCKTTHALHAFYINVTLATFCSLCSNFMYKCINCSSLSVCTSCSPDYGVDSNNKCALCSILISNCSNCTDRWTCTICDSGNAINYLNTCYPCKNFMNRCLNCTDNSTCTQCSAGYLASVGTCKACSIFLPDCTLCTDINTCTKCDIGYAVNSTNKCRLCYELLPNCGVCPTNTTCQRCVPGYVLHIGQCKTCDLVHSDCNTCVDNVSCSICNKGYTVDVGGKCIKCSSVINHCDSCFDANTCQECYDPYEVDQNSKCRCKSPLYNVSDLCIDDPYCLNAYQKDKIPICSFCNPQKLYILDIQSKCICKLGYTEVNKICQQKCGDGILVTFPCDDNNTFDGDGCSSTCQIETDYLCQQLFSSGVSKCRFNKDVKLQFDSVWKIHSENKGLIYISLNSLNANIIKFYESSKFNFSVISNRSGTITILGWARNSEGQIVIQIEYNKTIEESMIELNFVFSNDTMLSNDNFLKFQLKGSNYPLAMSVFNDQYEIISKLQYYFLMGSYVLMLLVLFSDKFIGVEASNTLQLAFFSLLLLVQSGNWPHLLSTLFPFKFSTGLNQLLYQQKTYQKIKDLTFMKYGYLSICESFFLNNFTNCAILFVSFTIFIILFIIKTNKQNAMFQLNDCPQKKKLRKEMRKFRRVFRRIYNFTFHFSYIMILQVFVSLYVEASYLKQVSPFMMAINKFTAFWTFTILIVTILENYNHFFLSTHDTIVEKYQVGLREMSYKRVYFFYLFLNVFCIVLLNNKLFFGYPISCLLLVASLAYLVYLVGYRPYKHSFLIHGVTILLNHLMYILILAMITLLNFSVKINEFYHLIFSYTLMGFTFVVVFLAVIRVIIDFKYDANNVTEQIKIEIEANRKVEEQLIANQITKQTVQKQKPQKKKLSKNDHNTYLYENQKQKAQQIDFLNEIKKKGFLTEWEKDQIYHRIYERKPINWVQENEKEKKYKLLLAKEKEIIERDSDRQEMLRIKNQKANDKAYIDQMQNLKEKLRVSYLARTEKQVRNKQAKKKKRNKEKEGYLEEEKEV